MSDRIAVMNRGRYEQLGQPGGRCTSARRRASWPASSASATCCPAIAEGRADGYAVVRLADGTIVRVPRAAVAGTDRARDRRPAREDPAPRRRATTAPAGHNRLPGVVRDASYLGRRAPSTSSTATAASGSRSTSRTSSAPRTASSGAPGEDGPARAGRRTTPSSSTAGAAAPATASADRGRRKEERPMDRNDLRAPTPDQPPVVLAGRPLVAALGRSSPRAAAAARRPPPRDPAPSARPGTARRRPPATAATEVTGPLNFANWPAYIDLTEDESCVADADRLRGRSTGSRSTTSRTSRPTRTSSRRSPRRSTRASTRAGTSIVLTDYMAARLVAPGLGRGDRRRPTCRPPLANVRDELRGPRLGPGLEVPLPVAVGRRPASATTSKSHRPRPHVASATCSTTAFKGKVTLLTGYQDTFSLVSLLLREQGEHRPRCPTDMTARGRPEDPRLPQALRGQRPHPRASPATSTSRTSASGDTWVADRLVGRPGLVGRRGRPVRLPHRGLDHLDRQHAHPQGRRSTSARGRGDDRLRLRRRQRGAASPPGSTTSRRSRASARPSPSHGSRSSPPTRSSSRRPRSRPKQYPQPDLTRRGGHRRQRPRVRPRGRLEPVRGPTRRPDRARSGRARGPADPPVPRAPCPYLLMLPGLLWLARVLRRARTSRCSSSRLSEGTLLTGFTSRPRSGRSATTRTVVVRLLGELRQLDRVRRAGDDPVLPDRLPARLRDRLPGRALQEPAPVPGHRAVLHELPHPDDLVADHPRQRRAVPVARSATSSHLVPGQLQRDRDAAGRRRRAHLPVPAVHGPAALRLDREGRPPAHRGGPGPVRRSVAQGGAIAGAILGGAPAPSRSRSGWATADLVGEDASRRWSRPSRALVGGDRRRPRRRLPDQPVVPAGHASRSRCRASSRAPS